MADPAPWDDAYREGAAPWDIGRPQPRLADLPFAGRVRFRSLHGGGFRMSFGEIHLGGSTPSGCVPHPGFVVSVTHDQFAATMVGQSTFFSRKKPYCSAYVSANTSKFESGVSGVGLSQTAGFRPIRWTIMSDAANATCTRPSVADFPGRRRNVTGASGILNAVNAPAGGVTVGARIAGMHETFVTSKVVTLSARTSRTSP